MSHARRRHDVVGVVALVFTFAFTAVVALLLMLYLGSIRADRQRYVQCVSDIPTYVDAQETLYMEHECWDGVQP